MTALLIVNTIFLLWFFVTWSTSTPLNVFVKFCFLILGSANGIALLGALGYLIKL